ncbi:uncharacterized protein CEXT_91151 [Caerostris extrusa]|uniref:Uncharacterized protein n=1 Tax=Caerostris extrusa TaxID=172846 RepID=A0AAV4SGD6_CAEEX|nr:uncharacterized protein CEXT_91151 [Caerostris extrusa]
MNSFGLTLAVALLVLGVTSALPRHARSNAAREHDDGPEPQRDGRRDLSGQTAPVSGNRRLLPEGRRKVGLLSKDTANAPNKIFLGAGSAATNWVFIWHCCTPLAPKCKWWGCWFKLTLAVALLVLGVTSALPNQFMSALKDMPDLTQPENTMMGQSLKEMGVEICPDKLHLCPATADCCEKEDGKWDCCQKTTANAPNNIFLGAGNAVTNWVSSGIAAPPLAPKCKWWGCWFK